MSTSSGLDKVVEEAISYIQKPPSDQKKIQHLKIFLQDACREVVECFQAYGSWDATKQEFHNIPQWDILIENLRKLLLVEAHSTHEEQAPNAQPTLKRKSPIDGNGSDAGAEKRANRGGPAIDNSDSSQMCAWRDEANDVDASDGITTESQSDDIDSTDSDSLSDDSPIDASTHQQSQSVSTKDIVDSVTDLWRQAGLSDVFDIKKFVRSVDEDIIRNKGKKLKYHQIREQVAGGKTQVGKTAFKALVGLIAKERSVVTVVVTTTLDVRDKLATDLRDNYFKKIPEDSRPDCVTISKQSGSSIRASEHDEALNKCMTSYGVVVVNCTISAINKAVRKIAELRGTRTMWDFVLIKDESDTMDRTEDGSLGLEKALSFLTGKKELDRGGRLASPLMILNISATLLPIFLRIRNEQGNVVKTHFGQPHLDEYSGLDNMQPIGDKYLLDKELRRNNEPIPYWSDSVEELYADAHSGTGQRRGVLLLDAVNPRVTAEGNIQERAEFIQQRYPRFNMVVIWGTGGVKIKLAGHKEWLKDEELLTFVQNCFLTKRIFRDGCVEELCGSSRRPPISKILSAIVCHSGLGCPIAVVGYSRLLRGDSFRSSCVKTANSIGEMSVVPTHMLCVPGETQSLDNLVQMIGRATGTFKGILTANGHSKVTVLTHWRDWDIVHAYYQFQKELAERIPHEGLQKALSNTAQEYSKEADLRNKGKRSIGNKNLNHIIETPCAQGPPRMGIAWAERHGYGSYNRNGTLFRLLSPIPPSERAKMSPKQLVIEEHLYHRKYVSDVFSLVVRRALRHWDVSDVYHPKDSWQELFTAIPYVSYSREGEPTIKSLTKRWSTARATGQAGNGSVWVLKDFEGPILQRREGDGGGFTGEYLKLNEDILKFWDEFKDYISHELPLYKEEELRQLITEL